MKKIFTCLFIVAFSILCKDTILCKNTATSQVYHIKSASNLRWISEQCMKGNTFEGQYFYLENDINLDDNDINFNWIPIGTKKNNFNGKFLGKDRKIEFKIDDNKKEKKPLFGYIGSLGIVKDVSIYGTFHNVGDNFGMVCEVNKGTVSGCSVSGKIIGQNNIGGLVGINYNTIVDSEAKVDIKANTKAGGLIGIEKKGAIVKNCCVHKCKVDQLIKSASKYIKPNEKMEYLNKNVKNDEKAKIIGSKYIGGLVGYYDDLLDATQKIKNNIVFANLSVDRSKKESNFDSNTPISIGIVSATDNSNLFIGKIFFNLQ